MNILGLKIYTTEEWNALPPTGKVLHAKSGKIIIHHTATRNPPRHISRGGIFALPQQIQLWHRRRSWIDTGQHYTISVDGTIYEGRTGSIKYMERGLCVVGAHTHGHNNNWGIEIEGTFTKEEAKPEQIDSLVHLCAIICIKCNIDSTLIYGHRDFAATICPGDILYNKIPEIRKAVHDKIMDLKDYEEPKDFMPYAVFILPESRKFSKGSLTLYRDKNDRGLEVTATSGQGGYQTRDNVWIRNKGPIPPSDSIKGEYEIDLSWQIVSNNKDSLGPRFYPITPNPIVSIDDSSRKRSDVGLHLDANYTYSPGSAGCVVVLPEDNAWQQTTAALDLLKSKGHKKIPLRVIIKE